ncbi:MAG: Rv3654c family TadE-like protein [Jatrophihabitantaceae bacterium]
MSWRSDRGAATIWVLALGAVVLSVAMVITARGSAVLARHRLERAADVTALAAAHQIGRTAQPCAAASRIAAANAAVLVSCAVRLDQAGRSGTVELTVRRTVSFPLVGPRTLTSWSRAGRLP